MSNEEDCPSGYEVKQGDLPGWGTGLGSRLPLTRQGCADKCSGKDECLSFEHSNSQMLCNLNKVALPSRPRNSDFTFCMKTGKLLIENTKFDDQ